MTNETADKSLNLLFIVPLLAILFLLITKIPWLILNSRITLYYFSLTLNYSVAILFCIIFFVLWRDKSHKHTSKKKFESMLIYPFVVTMFFFYAMGAWRFSKDLPLVLASDYSIVEGTIENFRPGRAEHFSVDGLKFSTRRLAEEFDDFRSFSDDYRVFYLPNSKFIIDIVRLDTSPDE